MILTKKTEVFECETEQVALDLIERAKAEGDAIVEHAIKYKVKKDRKTNEIVEETWILSLTKKYTF